MRLTPSSDDTSTLAKTAWRPARRISSTASRPQSPSVSATTTCAPSRASRFAVALPIPAAAPVTSATLFSISTG